MLLYIVANIPIVVSIFAFPKKCPTLFYRFVFVLPKQCVYTGNFGEI